MSTALTYNAAGRIIQKTETVNGVNHSFAYSYDQTGRLSDISKDGSSISHYEYDQNGNRTLATLNGASFTGSYDVQDRLSAYGTFTYHYNSQGQLTDKTNGATGDITRYNFDVLGNLRSVVMPDGTTIDYLIDGLNHRIGKKVNGNVVKEYLYQDDLRIAAELDASGAVVSRFVYGNKANVPEYMIKGGVSYEIVTDHLGSPKLVLNSSDGSIAEQIDYDEFGNILSDSNPGFQPFGFAGCLYDRDTKLCRFGAREYDPETGRWLQRDPILFAGGNTNLYGYVLNDPINFLDLDGLSTSSASGGGNTQVPSNNCGAYGQLCGQTPQNATNLPNQYYCKAAPALCGNLLPGSKDSAFSQCVRGCLQGNETSSQCSSSNESFAQHEADIHVHCFSSCSGLLGK